MVTEVLLDVDGRSVPARPGESIAAALIRAGLTAWRQTPQGNPRGLFCGMGVCQDCVISVDGQRPAARLHDQGERRAPHPHPGDRRCTPRRLRRFWRPISRCSARTCW